MEKYLNDTNNALIKLFNKQDQLKTSIMYNRITYDQFNYNHHINEMNEFLNEFLKHEKDILELLEQSKYLVPFKLRQQKLIFPNNKCTSIIDLTKANVSVLLN